MHVSEREKVLQTKVRQRRLRELLERALANMNVSEEEWVRAVRETRDER